MFVSVEKRDVIKWRNSFDKQLGVELMPLTLWNSTFAESEFFEFVKFRYVAFIW